jgi:hypothetical protein
LQKEDARWRSSYLLNDVEAREAVEAGDVSTVGVLAFEAGLKV